MLVRIIKNENYVMTEDFKQWVDRHSDDIFKVKETIIGNDGEHAYRLFKVAFNVSKHFTEEIEKKINNIKAFN